MGRSFWSPHLPCFFQLRFEGIPDATLLHQWWDHLLQLVPSYERISWKVSWIKNVYLPMLVKLKAQSGKKLKVQKPCSVWGFRLLFDLSFLGLHNSVYLLGSLTMARCLLFLGIVLISPGLYDLTHDNNLTAKIKLPLRLFAMWQVMCIDTAKCTLEIWVAGRAPDLRAQLEIA